MLSLKITSSSFYIIDETCSDIFLNPKFSYCGLVKKLDKAKGWQFDHAIRWNDFALVLSEDEQNF